MQAVVQGKLIKKRPELCTMCYTTTHQRSGNNSLLALTEMQQLGALWPALQMLIVPLIYTLTFTLH